MDEVNLVIVQGDGDVGAQIAQAMRSCGVCTAADHEG